MNFLITYEEHTKNIFIDIENAFKILFDDYKFAQRIKSYHSSLYASLFNDKYHILISINYNGSYYDLSEKISDIRYDLTIILSEINSNNAIDTIEKSYKPISYNKEYRYFHKNSIILSSNEEIINDIIETSRYFIDKHLYLFDSSDLGLL